MREALLGPEQNSQSITAQQRPQHIVIHVARQTHGAIFVSCWQTLKHWMAMV